MRNCVAVKSGGHFTATQQTPDRGGRCPAGQRVPDLDPVNLEFERGTSGVW